MYTLEFVNYESRLPQVVAVRKFSADITSYLQNFNRFSSTGCVISESFSNSSERIVTSLPQVYSIHFVCSRQNLDADADR